MSAASVTARGRRAAESLMRDTCRIERQTGTALDPVTLEEVPTWAPVLTDQPCRVQRFRGQGQSDLTGGGYDFGAAAIMVQLPISARGVRRDDQVTITAVGEISDPDLIGVVASVREDLSKTHATKRTLMCQEVSL